MNPWLTLGIEATTDLRTIKKAYAAQLKHTRPDDDAAAYQALRTAYEQAQELAKWAALENSLDVATEESEDVQPVACAEATPPYPQPSVIDVDLGVATAQVAEALTYTHPRELVHETLDYLRQAGADALVAGWPNLRHALDQLPLRLHPDASNWFAQLVIDEPLLPPAFAQALSEYFAWENDFRAWQWLGPARATALREQLLRLAHPEPTPSDWDFHPDDDFRQRYMEVSVYGQLLEHATKWRVFLFAMLASSRLARLWNELSPRQRYAIGVPKPPLHTLADQAIELGIAFRTVLAIFLASVLLPLGSFWKGALLVTIFGAGSYMVMDAVYTKLRGMKHSIHTQLWRKNPQPSRSTHIRLASAAWLCLVFAAIATRIWEDGLQQRLFTLSISLLLAFVALPILVAILLPPPLPRSTVSKILPVLLAWCVLALYGLPWLNDAPLASFLAGAAWLFACIKAQELGGDRIEQTWKNLGEAQQHRRQKGLPSNAQSLLWLFLAILRLTVTLPYRLILLASTQSPQSVVAIMGLSLLVLAPSNYQWLIPVTVCAMGLMTLLSHLCYLCALTALTSKQARVVRKGWLGLAMLGLWLAWASLYWRYPALVNEPLGWPAPESSWQHLWRALMLYLVPLLVLTFFILSTFRSSKADTHP